MLNRLSLVFFAAAIASSACTSSDDGIWMPPAADGKADGFTTIQGSDIPSAFVDPNKSYMIKRTIANLSAVGALDADETSLAKRVDGIIANMPADGSMHLAELVRMENPTIHSSLFAGEQAALPKLWKMMEAPETTDSVYGPKDNFGVLDSSTQPAAAVPPASLAISTLATELQAPAQRLENVYNSDNDASTVTLADLASGVANPGAFTQAEVTAFGGIQAVFRDKAVAQSTAQLDVSPGPGPFAHDATLGPASFHMAGTTAFDEVRNLNGSMSLSLTATQTMATTVALPANAQVLVLDQDTGNESVFGSGQVPSLGRGVYVFEVWQNGQRAFVTNADLPATTANNQIQLNDKLDYTLVSGLTPLVRNLNSATATYQSYYGYTYAVHYTFDKTTLPPPANAAQQAVTGTASPTLTIPVGRYSFPQSNAALYVYANNVAWFSYGGTQYRLLPLANSGNAPTRLQAPGLSVVFDASNNTLSCGNCNPSISVQLKSSMRDI